jgi:hypothetical protein
LLLGVLNENTPINKSNYTMSAEKEGETSQSPLKKKK